MNRNLTLLTALGAGLLTTGFAQAQAPAAPQAASAAQAPTAVDAKIALINFEQTVIATNEGQTVALNTQKKYEPKKAQLEQLQGEIDTLKKGLTPTLSDDERTSRLRQIDIKEKQLNRDAEDANTQYTTELQESLNKVAGKVAQTARTYADTNGYTIMLDVSGQQNAVFWVSPKVNQDISQAVVDAYNRSSGVPAPPPQSPSAPSASRPATRTPARTAPKP